MSDMDTTGAFNARANFGLTPSLTLKNIVQIHPSVGSAFVHELDYNGSDYTASVKVYNPNVRRAPPPRSRGEPSSPQARMVHV